MTKPNVVAMEARTSSDKILRFLWRIVQATLYRWSPIPMHGWRRMLLKLFGAEIASTANPYPTTDIWAPWNLKMDENSCLAHASICYNVCRVEIGCYSRVSQYAYLCTASHDIRKPTFDLVGGPIVISDGAWIAAGSFLGPGVTVGKDAVVAARAVVAKDVEGGIVVGGNPAMPIGRR